MRVGKPDSAPTLSGKEKGILRQIGLELCYKAMDNPPSLSSTFMRYS